MTAVESVVEFVPERHVLNGNGHRVCAPVVLDTCVLVNDPDAMYAYPGTTVVIPLTVIEELDDLKVRPDDVGRAARAAARNIEECRVAAGGDLTGGAPLGDGSTLQVVTVVDLAPIVAAGLDVSKPDNLILAAAVHMAGISGSCNLVSADTAMRVKAAALGLQTADHQRSDVRVADGAGWYQCDVASQVVDAAYADGSVPLDVLVLSDTHPAENEFVAAKAGSASVLLRRRGDLLVRVDEHQEVWGLRPRSKEQRFALELLCDPSVPVVTLAGQAGTGKTMLALAAALEQLLERDSRYGSYERVMVLRPLVAVGRQDVGYLPGTLEEKLGPWMDAIVDTMVALGDNVSYKAASEQLMQLVAQDKLTLDSVTFLRGRSLQSTLVIVDEAQNLEPLTAKTIMTRLGAGSKVVLLGDTSQIDSPWLSQQSNALAVVRDLLSGSELYGHVTLSKGERSPVAELVATRM